MMTFLPISVQLLKTWHSELPSLCSIDFSLFLHPSHHPTKVSGPGKIACSDCTPHTNISSALCQVPRRSVIPSAFLTAHSLSSHQAMHFQRFEMMSIFCQVCSSEWEFDFWYKMLLQHLGKLSSGGGGWDGCDC